MAPAPVRPTSSKLAKVNFLTETVILVLLKYLIFKMNKSYKAQTTKTDHAKI